jgi:hypothetical protein
MELEQTGGSLNLDNGLAYDWNKTVSTSAAKAEFTMNISSIGLTGYLRFLC